MARKIKTKRYRSLPKRIGGVKIPKSVRRFADTPLGAELIGAALVALAGAAATSPAARRGRKQIQRFALMTAHAMNDAAHNAAGAVAGTFRGDGDGDDKEAPAPRQSRPRASSGSASPAH